MKWSVKSVKTFMGKEGQGFNCTLLRDGKPVADVINDASGGDCSFYWKDRGTWVEAQTHDHQDVVRTWKGTPEEKFFAEYADTQWYDENPEYPSLGRLRKGVDGVIAQLVEDVETEKQYRRWCRTKTCFRLKGDKTGEWRIIKMMFDPRVKQHIEKKYGDAVEEILNQRYA